MTDVYQSIRNVLSTSSDILYGISDAGYKGDKTEYQCALVVAVPHSRRTCIRNYKEEAFEALIQEARQRSIDIINKIAGALEQNGIRYIIPVPAQKNEEELIAEFSYKYIAVSAGLGWIGKNDVLITEQYGPEVTLNAIPD